MPILALSNRPESAFFVTKFGSKRPGFFAWTLVLLTPEILYPPLLD